jgi:hypothetical protein
MSNVYIASVASGYFKSRSGITHGMRVRIEAHGRWEGARAVPARTTSGQCGLQRGCVKRRHGRAMSAQHSPRVDT